MTILDSPYRFVVVPRGMPFYGVLDRASGTLIRDDLTRREAREIVKRKNSCSSSVVAKGARCRGSGSAEG